MPRPRASLWSLTTLYGGHGRPSSPTAQGSHLGLPRSDWQAEKHGVPVVTIDPRGTSTKCPGCGAKLRENGYRRLKCPRCGFEGDRDHIAILNIERRTLAKLQMGDLWPHRLPSR
ncbi:zinc ribbon domain-containing protein [Desulfurococcus amylolyticus]|uniref:zinc ribbon domain-containing protein n=1 Tax=Desulfurococcus amylolyticus TaxID=94694 RepID=UPI0018DD0733|nr:zinc ribbon domain-containing protein [Desulfurococcus amylolyticus]